MLKLSGKITSNDCVNAILRLFMTCGVIFVQVVNIEKIIHINIRVKGLMC